MSETNALGTFDHIALAVPDLGAQVALFAEKLGMVVEMQSDRYAVVVEPKSGFKIELSPSPDGEAHLRHLGFATEDVDGGHARLVEAGMTTSEAPHRRDFAKMYTSFLKQDSGLEIQLADYD